MTHRIAVIGYGAIAQDLVGLLQERGPDYAVAVLLATDSPSRRRVPPTCRVLDGVEGLAAFRPSLVVEAAGHGAVRDTVPACLGQGLSVLVSSVGALHDEALMVRLTETARRTGARILLSSGALGGLDYVRAARHARGLALTYESRKPPQAWREELARLGHDPSALREPLTLFDGDAAQAAAAYPANLNVAATLALAGPGFQRTRVRVVVDPGAGGNTHRVEAESELGSFSATIANRPSAGNPKTSRIVARALMAGIDQHFDVVVMV